MRAAGASVGRIMVPVGVFGFVVAMVAFLLNEKVVPAASLRATAIQADIMKQLSSSSWRSIFTTMNDPTTGKLAAMISAADFNLKEKTLQKVWVMTYTKSPEPSFILYAPKLVYENDKEWRIYGGSKLFSFTGDTIGEFKGDVWPSQVARLDKKPEDLLAGNLKDLDSFSMGKMREVIEQAKKTPQAISASQVANLEYGYYNKIALPLAALIFGLVGAPLGIRNHRTGAAAGFWLSVVIIFGYMTLANFMAVYAQGGVFPSWLASFSPIAIGLVFASVLIRKRNG
ncbi:MAG: LptF/LptG family permease [Fimbriimonadales bacterium]